MTEGNGVYAALAAAQGEYPVVPKNHTATVTGEDKNGRPIRYTYKYADLADILSAVRPILSKHKLAFTQTIERLDGSLVLRSKLFHADGSSIQSDGLPLPQPTHKPQQFGSALTFMRRYDGSSLLGITSEEDDDGSAVEQPGHVERETRPPRQSPPTANGDEHPYPPLGPSELVDDAIARLDETDPWRLGNLDMAMWIARLTKDINTRPYPEVIRAWKVYQPHAKGMLSAEEYEDVANIMRARMERNNPKMMEGA